MIDHSLRIAERGGELNLKQRLRTGEISIDLVRVLALLDVKEALEIAGLARIMPDGRVVCACDSGPGHDPDPDCQEPGLLSDIKNWISQLKGLLSRLPDTRVGVGCECVALWDWDPLEDLSQGCMVCSGSGNVEYVVPSERRILVAASVPVGRECLAIWETTDKGYGWRVSRPGRPGPSEVIDLAEAWAAEPTPDRERSLHIAGMSSFPGWSRISEIAGLRGDAASLVFQSASTVIGERRVRELVSKEIIGRL